MMMNAQPRAQFDTMPVPRLQVNLKLDPLRADLQLQRTLQLDASRGSSSSIDSNDRISAHVRTDSRDSNSDSIYDTNPNDNYDTDSSMSSDCDSTLSDESGRFDDADEECSQSETPGERHYNSRKEGKRHPAVSSRDSFLLDLSPKKRRRSNDWSLLQAQSGHSTTDKRSVCRDESHAIASTARFQAPALGVAPAGGDGVKAGRRSRFIEASMNDSASECEKPPSIFFREARTGENANKSAGNAATHRQSGIFRFGKAIASAFSPFGVFGHKSDTSKSAAQDANRQKLRDDALERAEKAYAELKKSGYKGTAKGSYLRRESEEKQRPRADDKSMSEKTAMNVDACRGDGQREVTTSAAHDRSGRTSSMSFASIIRSSHDSVRPEMRKQKSRKELHKQEKLLKRVSSLQEKLEKAQRELRQLTGPANDGNKSDADADADEHAENAELDDEDEEEGEVVEATVTEYIAPSEPPAQTYYTEPVFPRKFVPGALPSLPSERLLAQTESSSTAGDPRSPQGNASQSIHRGKKSQNDESIDEGESESKSKLNRPVEAPKPSTMTDSPSRKRKSPVPESTAAREASQSQTGANGHTKQELKQSPRLPQCRRSKLQKHVRGDSPGTVERKRGQRQKYRDEQPEPLSEKTNEATRKRSSHFPRPSSRSPAARLRRTSLSSLRMKKKTSGTGEFCIDLDQGDGDGDEDSPDDNGAESQQQQKCNFYMQDQRRLDSSGPNSDAIAAAKAATKTRSNNNKNDNVQIIYDENIPPVPPLPKDLLANAAKIDPKGATATATAIATQKDRNENGNGKKGGRTAKTLRTMPSDEFRWPDEIF